MFDNVPIQKRWKIILGIIGFAFVFSLFYAVQVWNIYAKVDALKHKTALVEDADLQIVNRQVRLKHLSDNIRNLQANGQVLPSHVELMQYIENLSLEKDLVLIQLPKEQIENVDGYEISHVDFSVEGMFHDILSLINQIEAQDRVGSIEKADLELKTMRVEDDRQQMLIASIRLNRLVSNQTTRITEVEDE